jgi:hypothetical protein
MKKSIRILEKANLNCSDQLNAKLFILLFAITVLASLLFELMTYLRISVFSWLTPRLWLVSAFVITCMIIYRGICRLIIDIKNKNILPLFVAFAGVLLLLWPIIDNSHSVLGQDATQQMAAGLAAYGKSDMNYTGQAFLGYPARQYLLSAWPALILGRTYLALKIGFAWPFWLGLIIFADGLRKWTEHKKLAKGEYLVMFCLTAVMAFPYVTEYYLYFEHTLYPLCFALQLIGWLFHFYSKPTLLSAFAIVWTGIMLIYCYTTALAVVCLLVMLFLCVGLLSRDRGFFKSFHLVSAGVITLNLVFSVIFGRGDRASVLRSNEMAELAQAAVDGLKIALLHQPAVFASFLLPLVWLYLVVGLGFRMGKLHFVISGWIIAVFMLSQMLQGYAVYPAPISFSRTLITVPVLVTGWLLALTGYGDEPGLIERYRKRCSQVNSNSSRIKLIGKISPISSIIIIIAIVANLLIGFAHIAEPKVQGDAAKYIAPGYLRPMNLLILDLTDHLNAAGITQDDEFNFVLCTDNVWLKNPADYTEYFYPEANIYLCENEDELPADMNVDLQTVVYAVEGSIPNSLTDLTEQIENDILEIDDRAQMTLQRLIY